MKNHYKTMLATLVVTLQLLSANSQTVEWVHKIGSTGGDAGTSVAVDAADNIFSIGNFNGTVDFNPGPELAMLTSSGQDVFFTKMDPSGNLIWVNHISGPQTDSGTSIAVDLAGNAYVTGFFFGSVAFYSNTDTITMIGFTIAADMFIAKYDALGNFVWAKQIGGEFAERGLSITVDNEGNVYTTGYFEATTDFDPGVDTFILETAGPVGTDAFISKLDTDGNFVWAKQLGGVPGDQGISISVDAEGNVYTTGYFNGTSDFDPGDGVFELTSNGNSDIFISKLDSSGDFVWAKSIGGPTPDNGNSIFIDALSNVYITGSFTGTVDFDTSSGTFELTASGVRDIFVAKFDVSGNLTWAKRMGGTGDSSFDSESGNAITVDSVGNVYITGSFRGTSDFDPGADTFNLAAANGSSDTYVCKLNASGNFLWAIQMVGTDLAGGNSIALDASNNILVVGNFYETVDFNPNETETFNLTSAGSSDIFILKLEQDGTVGIVDYKENVQFTVYPNPSNGLFSIVNHRDLKNASIEVYDLAGRIVHTQRISSITSEIDLSNKPSGVYLLTVMDDDQVLTTRKLVIW